MRALSHHLLRHHRSACGARLISSGRRAMNAAASSASGPSLHVDGVPKQVIQLTGQTYAYLVANTREPTVLAACREDTLGRRGAHMQVPPEQGALLAFLVEVLGARRVLEVGTFTGYSSTAMALALPPDGQLVTCEKDSVTLDLARDTWTRSGVDGRLGPAMDTLDAMLPTHCDAFDMAFIDADKTAYGAYYERCLKLVRAGGIIAVDNTLWYGKVADLGQTNKQTAALREFNAYVLADERVTHVMVPIGDGLTLLRRR